MLRRLVEFLASQPSDQRIYIGVRRLGKESALVTVLPKIVFNPINLGFFPIRPPPGWLPVSGPLERFCDAYT